MQSAQLLRLCILLIICSSLHVEAQFVATPPTAPTSPPNTSYTLDFQSPFPESTFWTSSPTIPASPEKPFTYKLEARTATPGYCYIYCDDAPSFVECRTNNCTSLTPYTESYVENSVLSHFGLFEIRGLGVSYIPVGTNFTLDLMLGDYKFSLSIVETTVEFEVTVGSASVFVTASCVWGSAVATPRGARASLASLLDITFGFHNMYTGMFEVLVDGERIAQWNFRGGPQAMNTMRMDFTLCASNGRGNCRGVLDYTRPFELVMNSIRYCPQTALFNNAIVCLDDLVGQDLDLRGVSFALGVNLEVSSVLFDSETTLTLDNSARLTSNANVTLNGTLVIGTIANPPTSESDLPYALPLIVSRGGIDGALSNGTVTTSKVQCMQLGVNTTIETNTLVGILYILGPIEQCLPWDPELVFIEAYHQGDLYLTTDLKRYSTLVTVNETVINGSLFIDHAAGLTLQFGTLKVLGGIYLIFGNLLAEHHFPERPVGRIECESLTLGTADFRQGDLTTAIGILGPTELYVAGSVELWDGGLFHISTVGKVEIGGNFSFHGTASLYLDFDTSAQSPIVVGGGVYPDGFIYVVGDFLANAIELQHSVTATIFKSTGTGVSSKFKTLQASKSFSADMPECSRNATQTITPLNLIVDLVYSPGCVDPPTAPPVRETGPIAPHPGQTAKIPELEPAASNYGPSRGADLQTWAIPAIVIAALIVILVVFLAQHFIRRRLSAGEAKATGASSAKNTVEMKSYLTQNAANSLEQSTDSVNI